MKLSEGISVGFTAIVMNKMRAFLTMLGIIIGVASVLAMIATGTDWKENEGGLTECLKCLK